MDETAKKRMQEILEAYGADPKRWPAGTRLPDAALGAEVKAAAEVDSILDLAKAPVHSQDAIANLLASLPSRQGADVVQFPGPRSKPRLSWAFAAPLAASLMLGIYLGAAGGVERFLPQDDVAWLDDVSDTGLEDAEDVAEDSQS
ncbi:MAG: hypothetical protein ACKVP5_00745 [Aestuariivirga sp.]